MLWMGGSGWGELLLVAGGLKPLACQLEIEEYSEHEVWIENPFTSKFSTIDDFEKHITELGVIFHIVRENRAIDSAHIYGKTYAAASFQLRLPLLLQFLCGRQHGRWQMGSAIGGTDSSRGGKSGKNLVKTWWKTGKSLVFSSWTNLVFSRYPGFPTCGDSGIPVSHHGGKVLNPVNKPSK